MSTFYRSGKISEEYELDSQVFLSHTLLNVRLFVPQALISRDKERLPFKRLAILITSRGKRPLYGFRERCLVFL